jgi:hypothetical protein
MDVPESALADRARRAYERGQVVSAGRRSLLLAPLPVLALGCGCQPRTTVIAGALFLAAVFFCYWRGGTFRRGAGPGIAAGLVPLLAPSLCQAACTHGCSPQMMTWMPLACGAGGLAGGLLLAFVAPRPALEGGRPFLIACVIASLAGAVGCLAYGATGLVIMVAAFSIGALPVLAVKRA